jgi:hypothetical protein
MQYGTRMDARNALAEARTVAGADAWVLEPSPPAVTGGPFMADDPTRAGDLDWEKWVADHPGQSGWTADRWLAAWPRLGAAPSTLVDTRLALHRLAFYVIAPARLRANGKIGLRWTLGGFGTPFFGDDEQVRVAGDALIVQRRDSARAESITTLADAAQFVLGGPPDVEWPTRIGIGDCPELGDVSAPLEVDPDAAAFLCAWCGFGWSVLEEFRSDAASSGELRVQLWPEHFDASVGPFPGEPGATFGFSPGDGAYAQPYVYVSVGAEVTGELWTATAFKGAILPLDDLVSVADQRATVLEFFRTRRSALLES